jgi:lysyl-tRNA synthetase class 2
MTEPNATPIVDENRLIAERRAKLARVARSRQCLPNDFHPDAFAGRLQSMNADKEHGRRRLEAAARSRARGRAHDGQAHHGQGQRSPQIQDQSGRIQLFLQQSTLGDAYEAFKGWDVGDIVAAEGQVLRTKTGELSVKVDALSLLVKSLRPLPDKWHGLSKTSSNAIASVTST